jgi:hypothetical protein
MTDYRPSRAVHVAATPPINRRQVSCSRVSPGDRIAGAEYTTLQAPRPHRTHPPGPTSPEAVGIPRRELANQS